VWLRRGALDRRLAHGADPRATPELARRARQLTSRRCRAGLAEGIRNLIDAAEEPERGYSAAVPLQRRAILAERDFLLALAADLRSDDELSPRGIALVEHLLTDGMSPLYAPGPEGGLHNALTHARAALHLA
jgi:hypothetical protein